MLEVTREHSRLVDDYCAEAGRDPLTLRRSILVFHSDVETVYDSVDAFEDDVRHFREVGIDGYILMFPLREEHLPVFERIAGDAIPKLRAEYLRSG